jgi:predicted membrane protein
MENKTKSLFDPKVVLGLFIIILGGALLLRNMNIIGYVNVWEWWPVILISIGLGYLIKPQEKRQNFTGGFLVFFGAVFLLNNLDVIDVDFRDIWPFMLIMVGTLIIRSTLWKGNRGVASSDTVNLSLILGGGDHFISSENFKGGSITAIMGGGSIDLHNCTMVEDEVDIEVFAFWGGFDLRVPEQWEVVFKGMPILGGMENKTRTTYKTDAGEFQAGSKKLIIRGVAIMGGIEVKN